MITRDGDRRIAGPFSASTMNFVVEVVDDADRAVVEELLADLSEGDVADCEVFSLIRRHRSDATEAWDVSGRTMGDHRGLDLPDALTRLLAALSLAVLDAEPSSLHLHAGAVAEHGRAIIVAAQRGTGKTTTVAHLVRRGWSFLTDEMVVLPSDGSVTGVARPLAVKPEGREHLDFLSAHLLPDRRTDGGSRFVPVGATGAKILRTSSPGVVVLLRRDTPRSTPSTAVIHPADAVVGLMERTMDAGRYGPNAVLRLAELAAASTCAVVHAGEPNATAAAISELGRSQRSEAVEVHHHVGGRGVPADVHWVTLGDRAVIHQTVDGQILALNDEATQIWIALVTNGGPRDVPHGAEGFVRELADHGLITVEP